MANSNRCSSCFSSLPKVLFWWNDREGNIVFVFGSKMNVIPSLQFFLGSRGLKSESAIELLGGCIEKQIAYLSFESVCTNLSQPWVSPLATSSTIRPPFAITTFVGHISTSTS
jgi:hypothetical protein